MASFLTPATPPQGFGMPSTNGGQVKSTAPNPLAQAGSYANQQLGGLISGTTSTTGSSTPGDLNPATPQMAADATATSNQSAQNQQNLQDSIQQSNVRLNTYAAAAGAKMRAQQQASQGGGGAVGGGMNLNNGGMTVPWKVDGGLDAQRNKALALASTYLGDPYVLGGESHRGIDCSGLVQAVYSQLGFKIPVHGARWQGQNIPGVRTAFSNLQPGDLVCWKDGSHIAIYAGHGQIIEAPNPQRGVVRRALWASPNAVFGIHLRFRGE